MSDDRFEFGDRVRHAKRPEWGVGSVVKTEDLPVNGQISQRVSVRFPGVGVKSLCTPPAELARVDQDAETLTDVVGDHPVNVWHEIGDSEWLAGVAQKKIEEAMIRLPEEAKDPFRTIEQRIVFTLGLYRFDRTGRGLIDWAVAQTTLDDPLSRFNRHELEQYFDRWAYERDAHLKGLIQEYDGEPRRLDQMIEQAPPAARKVLKKRSAAR